MTENLSDEPMGIVGYADRLSVCPGERIEFKISSRQGSYRSSLRRLIHGDTNPAGPGFKDEAIPSSLDGTHRGSWKTYPHGSHVEVPDPGAELAPSSFTVQAWLLATSAHEARVQGIVGRWADGAGWALVIDESGAAALLVGDGSGATASVVGRRPLRREWTFLAATFDAGTGRATLAQVPCRRVPDEDVSAVETTLGVAPAVARGDLYVASLGQMADGHLDGKLERPRLFARPLDAGEVDALAAGADPDSIGGLLAAWDLGADPGTDTIPDLAGDHPGTLVNVPTRPVPGHAWTGAQTDPARAPEEFRAIHFHQDDMSDARWATDFALTVPDELPSGVYAVHVEAEGEEDYVPFFVRAPRGRATAPVAVLFPTLTYLAYGNEHVTWQSIGSPPPYDGIEDELQHQDHHTVRHRLLSLYDSHSDGSGVAYSSRLRPIVNMRPKYAMALLRSPHLLNADLHLVDWLEAKGQRFDAITDEDLHHEGAELLAPYKAVLTGSHPEYWSGPMLDGLEGYLDGGGRMMYLGANGFYWVTVIDPSRPHVVEVRRGHVGTGTWRSDPGEEFASGTGERGGPWRYRGRAPQLVCGIGYTATGYTPDMPPYRRTEASLDPRASWIFEGVAMDEPIGDFGLVLDGAAGFELDRADDTLGTPPHALLVAQATGYSDGYQALSEEIMVSDSLQGGTVNPLVRADMVYYEGPDGGAVFSTGAISWCGSLSHADYENNVSRITENVLRRFVDG